MPFLMKMFFTVYKFIVLTTQINIGIIASIILTKMIGIIRIIQREINIQELEV
jgi:hypothetical protein